MALLLAPGSVVVARAQPVPQGSPLPFIAPPATPFPSAPPAAPAPLPPPAALPAASFTVSAVVIEGATAYPASRLAGFTRGLVGQRSLGDIEAARRGILLLYRDDGYPYVTVSARLDTGGVLRIIVVESYVADVKLAGENIGPVGTLVLRFMQHLVDKRPLNNADYEHWVLLANSIPGVTVSPVLQRLESEPGAFTLIARVSHTKVSGEFTADNDAFPKTGREEGLLALGLNSLSAFGERSQGTFYFAGPNGRELFGQFDETFFVGASGLQVRLYAGAGDTTPCCDLAAIGYDGKTVVYGVQAIYPLLLSRDQQLFLRGSLDATDLQTVQEDARASGDSLRVLRADAQYTLTDALFGVGRPGDSSVSAEVSHGLSFLGASANGRTDAGRLNENIDFTKFRAEISRDQTLFTLPQDVRVSAFGLAAGQATGDVLPTTEEFYLGGLRYTRGFYAGEVVGDNAVAATAELRLTTHATLDLFGRPLTLLPQLFVFRDWGETWQNQSTDANHRLRSYGLGARVGIAPHLQLQAIALRRDTRQTSGSNVKPDAASTFYWSLAADF